MSFFALCFSDFSEDFSILWAISYLDLISLLPFGSEKVLCHANEALEDTLILNRRLILFNHAS